MATAASERDVHRRLSLCINRAQLVIVQRLGIGLLYWPGCVCEGLSLPTATVTVNVYLERGVFNELQLRRDWAIILGPKEIIICLFGETDDWGGGCWFFLTKSLPLVRFKPVSRIMIYRGSCGLRVLGAWTLAAKWAHSTKQAVWVDVIVIIIIIIIKAETESEIVAAQDRAL